MISERDLKSHCNKVTDTKDGGFDCLCNCHNDHHPSFHWKIGRVGWIGKCKACNVNGADFAKVAGINVSDLFMNAVSQNQKISKTQYGYERNCIDKYPYFRIDNGLQTHIKYRLKPLENGKKNIKQGYDKDGEWINTLKNIDTSLSVFSNVPIEKLKHTAIQDKRVYHFEGEADTKTGGKYGLVGFTIGSATEFDKKKEVFKYIKDALLVIFGDNDSPGINCAEKIRSYYEKLGGRAIVIIPPGVPPGGDISDYMQSHTKEDLQKLISDALNDVVKEDRECIVDNGTSKAEAVQVDLMQFHLVAENGKLTGVYHNAIFEYIKSTYNIFICGGTPYIYDSGFYKVDMSGARLKSIIRGLIFPQFVKSTTINNIYTLFLQDINLELEFEQLNCYPSHWICFQNGMYDTKEKRLLPHSPEYRAINQIPYNFNINLNYEGKKTEEYLNFICEEPDSREMLLQFIGYSLTKDVGQQKFLVLNGEGGTGKSTVIRLIETLVGSRNVSNISLADLQQRFASFGLMGKLLNSCADLEISALEDTSVIKKILGEDTLRAEQKGKDAISFKSYAKLIFSTNELPLVKSEKTNGFYRRLLVLTMNKVPEKKNPNLYQELVQEIDYLLQLAVQAVERMYQQETITISEASEKAVLQLRADSDTVEAFLQEICSGDEKGRIERTDLYRKYADYCEETDRQSLTKNNFYKSLRVKGYTEIKTSGYRYFKGISYLKDCQQDALNSAPSGFVNITQEQLNELPFD